MKSTLAKVALTGALAITGLGVGAVSDSPINPFTAESASANYLTSITDYDGRTLSSLHANSGEAPYNHSLTQFVQKTTYKPGDRMAGWLNEAGINKFNDLHLKYYHINSNGTLDRWKTVYGVDLNLAFYEFTWTSTHPKGQYAIVYTYRDDNNVLRSAYKKVTLQ